MRKLVTRVAPKDAPKEPGEAVRYDGTADSGKAVVAFAGRDHAAVDEDGTLSVHGVPVPSGGYVVNGYRGGFLVLAEAEFAAGWRAA